MISAQFYTREDEIEEVDSGAVLIIDEVDHFIYEDREWLRKTMESYKYVLGLTATSA